MKKLIAMLMALAMTAGLLAGCGGSDGSSAAPADNGTDSTPTAETGSEDADDSAEAGESGDISFSWWGGDSRHEATQNAVAAFTDATGISVATSYGAWDGWESTVSTQIYAGTSSDVLQSNWNWLTEYGTGGNFADLNEYADIIDLSQFDDNALAACTVDGQLLGIPVAMTGRLFYWNKATWDAAGLELPKTIDDLLAAGPVFASELGDDYYPLYLEAYDRQILMVWALECMYGKNWVENGEMQYTQEEIEEGLAWIQALEDAHVIPSVPTIDGDGADTVDKNPKWMEGRYAGVFEWDTAAGKQKDALNEEQEFVVGDYLTGVGDYQGGFTKVSMCLSISGASADKEAAAQLINYLLNDPEGITLMASERGIPASAIGLSTLQAAGLVNELVAEANGKVMDWCQFQLDTTFEASSLKEKPTGMYYEVFDGLSYGDYDISEAAEILIESVEKELNK